MADRRLSRQLFAGLNSSSRDMDDPAEILQFSANDDLEATFAHVDVQQGCMPSSQQNGTALEIQHALEKLEHTLSADAHATRLSELRSKQRLVESLSQAPPPASQLFAPRPAVAQGMGARMSPERVPRPIALNEVLHGLRRSPSSPRARHPNSWPASPPTRALSPRALHFTNAIPTPAAAVGPGGASSQRPMQRSDLPFASAPSPASTPRASRSPDPLSRSRGRGSSSSGVSAGAAAAAAPGRARPASTQRLGGGAAGLLDDVASQQPRRPLSPPLLQQLEQQLRSQSRQHLQQHHHHHNQQQYRSSPVEPMQIRPQSAGRRYMSPGSAVASRPGSGGGSGGGGSGARDAAAAAAASRRSSGGGGSGGGRWATRSRSAVPEAASGGSRGAPGANLSNLDSILRGLGAGGGGGANAATAAGQTQMPLRSGSVGGGNGGSSRGRYMPPHRDSGDGYRASRPHSAGSLGTARHRQPSSPALVGAAYSASGRATAAAAAAGGSARPWSAPRSLGAASSYFSPQASPPSAVAAAAAAAARASAPWASGLGAQPSGLRTASLLSSARQQQQPLGLMSGGAGRAASPSLLTMATPFGRARGAAATAAPPSHRATRPTGVQGHSRLQPVRSALTQSLQGHAAAAQRLQTQVLEETIADGAGEAGAGLSASPPPPPPRSDASFYGRGSSDGEGALYEVESLGVYGIGAGGGSPLRVLDGRLGGGGVNASSSSVQMVEALLRNSLAAVGSMAGAASNEVRSWAAAGLASPRRAFALGPADDLSQPPPSPSVLFSPVGTTAAGPGAALLSPLQPARAGTGPQGQLLHPFIVPSGPLWPSGGAGGGSPVGLALDMQQQRSTRPLSPRPLSPLGIDRDGGGDSGGEGRAGSPLRPQGLAAAGGGAATSSRSSPSVGGSGAGSSPDHGAQGLHALLSFLQQKFQLRWERRRAARALEGWRRAAGSASGGGAAGRVARAQEAGGAGGSPGETRLGRYESPGSRSGSPIDSMFAGSSSGGGGAAAAAWRRSVSPTGPTMTRPAPFGGLTIDVGRSSGGGGVAGNGTSPHRRISGGGSSSPGTTAASASRPAAGIPPAGLHRPTAGWSLSSGGGPAGGVIRSPSSPGRTLQPLQPQDLLHPPNARRGQQDGVARALAEEVASEEARQGLQRQQQEREVFRIQQLQGELEQARQQQEQLLRHQQQEQHHSQLQQLQQQLQELQEQLVHHHRQQQEQLEALQQRQVHQQQQHLRPLSPEALLRGGSSSTGGGGAAAGAAAQLQPQSRGGSLAGSVAGSSTGGGGVGMRVPPRPRSVGRAPASVGFASPLARAAPSAPSAAAAGGGSTGLGVGAAAPASPKAVAPVGLGLAVSSPGTSKAAFRDLHNMVGEMERLLSAMNDDVAGAAAAAAGTPVARGKAGGAAAVQPAAAGGRGRAAASPSHLHPQPRAAPHSPGLRSSSPAARAAWQYRPGSSLASPPAPAQPPAVAGARALSGGRSGGARGSLAGPFATAAAAGSSNGSGGGSGSSSGGGSGGGSGGAGMGGTGARGAVSSSGAAVAAPAATRRGVKAASVGGVVGSAVVAAIGGTAGGSVGGGGSKMAISVKDAEQLRPKRQQIHGTEREPEHKAGSAAPVAAAAAAGRSPASMLASAGRTNVGATPATDALSDQLREMRASIQRIEEQMWGAAAATQSLARGVAAAAAAAGSTLDGGVGSPAVLQKARQQLLLAQQQAQARPYEASAVAVNGAATDPLNGGRRWAGRTADTRAGSAAGAQGPQAYAGSDAASKSWRSVGGGGRFADGPLGGGGGNAAAATAGPAAFTVAAAAASAFEPATNATLSSRTGSIRTSFSFRDGILPLAGVASSAGGSSAPSVAAAARTAAVAADRRAGGRTALVVGGGSIASSVAAELAAAAGSAGGAAAGGSVGSPPSSPGVTRHVDALEAQLLEELGELEDALQQLKTNTGKAVGTGRPGSWAGAPPSPSSGISGGGFGGGVGGPAGRW